MLCQQVMRWLRWRGGGTLTSPCLPSHLHSVTTLIPDILHKHSRVNCQSNLCMPWTQKRVYLTACSCRIQRPIYSYSYHGSDYGQVYSGSCRSLTRLRGGGEVYCARTLFTSPTQHMFWEKEPKSGYGSKTKQSNKQLIKDGLKELRSELSKWQDELKEKLEDDPIIVRPGDMDKVWELNSSESLERWIVTSDSDHGEGFSSSSLSISPTGHGLFSGHLSTQVPKDGRVKKAGYCNMKSIRPRRSFKREVYLDWTSYTHLELRVRGDGRSYLLNIGCAGYFDITWNDIYSYVLYTRGGPHWQISRIPFSKFFMSSKGRVQDSQCPFLLNQVASLGITAGDRTSGPFRLEIDYIGVYFDPNHTEKFAYEMYKVPKLMGP